MLNATSRLQIDYTGMMQSELNPSGWTIDQLGELQPMLDQAYSSLLKMRETGDLDFSKKLYEMLHEVDKLVEISNEIANSFENFVVLGIGGSALGPIAVHQALRPYYYNELPQEHRGRPRFYVIDNIDPVRFHDFLRVIDLKKTCFNVITKSGSTSETMAQFLIVRDMLKQVCGRDYNRHIIVTTDKEKGNLLPIALEEGYTRFEIPQGIGGRFSELTAVGLLPAAVCGIDITALLQGAIEMDTWVRDKKEIMQNPAQLRAGLSYLSWREKKNISVFMPYSDALKTMSDWYAQLWAESLGKRFNRDGQEVWVGQTPVKSLGVTDQHSQVQLYTEGPNDKVITFLSLRDFKEDFKIPADQTLPDGVSFLGGHTLGDLLTSELKATEYALSLAGRQHQNIILQKLDAQTIGQLILLLEWETAYMGELLNINAYDQPGVEEGKAGTYALMGRIGFEERKKEIEKYGKKRYTLT